MEKFKTVNQILRETQKTIYPTRAIYNLQRGFTLFLKRLEKENKKTFKLVGCSPKIIIRRTEKNFDTYIETNLKYKSIGNYASFIIKDKFYYIQFDEFNPLFEPMFTAVDLTLDKKIPNYFLDEIYLYNDADIYTNKKSQKYFKSIADCFYKNFEKNKNKNNYYFDRRKNAYNRPPEEPKQIIYYNI